MSVRRPCSEISLNYLSKRREVLCNEVGHGISLFFFMVLDKGGRKEGGDDVVMNEGGNA